MDGEAHDMPREYWGQIKPYKAEFAEKVVERFGDHMTALRRSGLAERIIRAWHHYYSRDRAGGADTSELMSAGPKGSQIDVRLNEFRTLIRHKISLALAQPLSFQPLALNMDSESLAAVRKVKTLIDHYQSRGVLKPLRKDLAETALVMSAAWGGVLWDNTKGEPVVANPVTGEVVQYSGDLACPVLNPLEVAYDTTSDDLRDPRWLIARRRVNRYEFAELYPKYKKQILGAPPIKAEVEDPEDPWYDMGLSPLMQADKDSIRPYFVYFKPSLLMPDGRVAIVLNAETIIYDGPISTSRVPFVPLMPSTVMGEDRLPYGDEHELLPLCEMMQDSYATLASSHAQQIQVLWAPDGDTAFDLEELGPFSVLVGGSVKPESINLFNLPQEAYIWPDKLLGVAQRFSMLNDAVLGQASASDSGSKLAFEASTSMQAQRGFTEELSSAMEILVTLLVEVLRAEMDDTRIASVVGKMRQASVERFTREHLTLVNEVVVLQADPMTDTPEGRQQLADMAAQKGWVDSLEDYVLAARTGQVGHMSDEILDSAVLIQRENEQLVAQGDPPVVTESDQHREHIKHHLGLLHDETFRRDPAIRQAVNAHITEHVLYLTPGSEQFFLPILTVTGQQPLPATDPATGAPAPAPMQPPNAEGMPSPDGPQGSAPKEVGTSGKAPGGPDMPPPPKTPGGESAPTPALGTNPVPPGANA